MHLTATLLTTIALIGLQAHAAPAPLNCPPGSHPNYNGNSKGWGSSICVDDSPALLAREPCPPGMRPQFNGNSKGWGRTECVSDSSALSARDPGKFTNALKWPVKKMDEAARKSDERYQHLHDNGKARMDFYKNGNEYFKNQMAKEKVQKKIDD